MTCLRTRWDVTKTVWANANATWTDQPFVVFQRVRVNEIANAKVSFLLQGQVTLAVAAAWWYSDDGFTWDATPTLLYPSTFYGSGTWQVGTGYVAVDGSRQWVEFGLATKDTAASPLFSTGIARMIVDGRS